MRLVYILGTFLLIAPQAIAQNVSDEALKECQTANTSFTAVKKCLPETDVAITMLSAVSSHEYYGDSGEVLVSACRELNDTSNTTWICVKNAISDAVELREMVGSPDKISDPRFAGVSDPKTYTRVEALENQEQGQFDRMMWGGTMYHPLN